MRKIRTVLALCLAVILLVVCCGCSRNYRDVSMEEIADAYEAAGYGVYAGWYDEPLEEGVIGYVQANHPNGDYIYFSFFANEDDAEAYKESYYHPGAMWMFSVIFGDPTWPRWEVYGCIVVEYDNPDFMEPFEELLKQ